MEKQVFNSAYGDAKFKSLKAAMDYYFRSDGVAFCKGDGYYLISTNRRASIFEKQGDVIVLSFSEVAKLKNVVK